MRSEEDKSHCHSASLLVGFVAQLLFILWNHHELVQGKVVRRYARIVHLLKAHDHRVTVVALVERFDIEPFPDFSAK